MSAKANATAVSARTLGNAKQEQMARIKPATPLPWDAPDGRITRADCTVRALAAVAGIPYSQAEKIAADAGRKPGRGFNTAKLARAAHAQGILFRKLSFTNERTLSRFMREYPQGRYLVRTRRHALAVIDGSKSDKTPNGKRVTDAWRLLRELGEAE